MKRFRPRPYRDKRRPHLKFVVNFREEGRRARSFFATKKEAETFADLKNVELLNFGAEAVDFSTALRVMAQEATAALAPYRKTIRDALDFYLPHLQASQRSCTFRALADELVTSKERDGASPRYLSDLRSRFGQFAAGFPNLNVADISAKQVDDWLRNLPVRSITRNNFRRVLIVAFNYGRTRGYCTRNPARESSKAKEVKLPAGILTVAQASDLLSHASPKLLPAIALGMFAGLRPEAEGPHLDWAHIDFADKTINIEPDKTKTDTSARYVDMSDNLISWLQPFRRKRGRVFPPIAQYYKLLADARIAARIKSWPNDVLRHSYGSYHYGSYRNAAVTQSQMGHTSAQIFFKHYRRPLKKSAAAPFWKIMPQT